MSRSWESGGEPWTEFCLSPEPHTIRLDGHLGIERYPDFHDAFNAPLRTGPVLVDLRDGTGADSVFLSELLLFKRRRSEPVAVLIPAKGNLARIFSLVGMGEKVDVYTDLADALRALGAAPAG